MPILKLLKIDYHTYVSAGSAFGPVLIPVAVRVAVPTEGNRGRKKAAEEKNVEWLESDYVSRVHLANARGVARRVASRRG